jgi:hypothetical protein
VRSGTTQLASDVTFHVHSRFVLIVTVADPPSAGNDGVGVLADTAHFVVVGAVVDVVVDEPQAAAIRETHRRAARRTAASRATNLPEARDHITGVDPRFAAIALGERRRPATVAREGFRIAAAAPLYARGSRRRVPRARPGAIDAPATFDDMLVIAPRAPTGASSAR